MKKITALFLIICMLFSTASFAASEESFGTVYLFGDDWAKSWGESLGGFFCEPALFVNAAGSGELLSKLPQKAEYARIKAGDVVILSYGILEKDRPMDKNADFKKSLEDVTAQLQKKNVNIVFASICSSVRFNSLTGQMAETKNFYTETTRSFAKAKGITYIDLASLTASMATAAGSGGINAIYKSTLELTERADKICAFEIFKHLAKIENVKGNLKMNLSSVFDINQGERARSIDVSLENSFTDTFAIYTKNGTDVVVEGQLFNDGKAIVAKSVNGKINVSFTSCEQLQLAPVFVFEAMDFATTAEPFKAQMYGGVYDISVRKSEALKASVYLDGYLIASNLDMPGTEIVPEAAVHTFDRYHFAGGEFAVTVKGLTDKLDFIMFRETDIINEKKIRIFVGGDSTVCNYYPLFRTGAEKDGTVMTGWAMFLEKYVDARVMNLAASGDWAKKWFDNSFSIVEKEGEKGDIFVVQFGINDRGKSTVEEMTACLSDMVDVCAEKGMIPILVSPQISAGYGWGDETDVGKSNGGNYSKFFDAVRDLATEKGCFYVDLTDMSSGWFSEVGREEVYKVYHLWDYENNAPKDMMHLSSRGADSMCRFFVLALEKLIEAKAVDKWGNSLEMLRIW
ncbi:MAG: hypothetical protein IJ435_04255 [Clostridia bacterium]|nr:hypothetical protein [Clostridia bacterium]